MNIFQAITCFILSTCSYEEIDGPNQIHLALGESKDQMVVSWADLEPRNGSEVQWGLKPDKLDHSSLGKLREIFNFGRKSVNYYAVMGNLKPDTTYYYQVGVEDRLSEVFSFHTFPDGDPDWQPRICIFGDLGWRNGRSIPRINNETLGGKYDMMIHIGDIAYDLFSDRGRVGERFLMAIEPAASKVPYHVIPGNHEYMPLLGDGGENYHKKFKMPGETNDYYTFKVGKIRFVVISTEFYYILEGGSSEKVQEQMKWMEKALTEANKPKSRKECPWLIVLGHRPVYCSDSKFGRCPQYSTWLREGRPGKYVGLEEVFYKYGVDVYFAGHNHQYERSKPVYKHITTDSPDPYLNPNMTIYVVSGAAGNSEGLDDFKKREPKWSGFRIVEYGYTQMIPFNGTHLLIEQIAINGTLLDSFTIVQYNHRMFGKFA